MASHSFWKVEPSLTNFIAEKKVEIQTPHSPGAAFLFYKYIRLLLVWMCLYVQRSKLCANHSIPCDTLRNQRSKTGRVLMWPPLAEVDTSTLC